MPVGNPLTMTTTELVSVPFRWGSAIRRRRIFHPGGIVASGTIERTAAANRGLPITDGDVIARVSKAVGTPGSLPDILGLAVRIAAQPDWASDWDVLLASAGSGVIGRAVGLRPVASWTDKSLSSLAPLRYRDEIWWLRARITTELPDGRVALDDVRRVVERGSLSVEVDQARGAADFEPLAQLTLNGLADSDVSFDPVLHNGPGVSLAPAWLAELRARAYGQSRAGRDADQVALERR